MDMKRFFLYAIAIAALALAGCGGGGGGMDMVDNGGTPPPATCPTGQTGTPPNCVTPDPDPCMEGYSRGADGMCAKDTTSTAGFMAFPGTDDQAAMAIAINAATLPGLDGNETNPRPNTPRDSSGVGAVNITGGDKPLTVDGAKVTHAGDTAEIKFGAAADGVAADIADWQMSVQTRENEMAKMTDTVVVYHNVDDPTPMAFNVVHPLDRTDENTAPTGDEMAGDEKFSELMLNGKPEAAAALVQFTEHVPAAGAMTDVADLEQDDTIAGMFDGAAGEYKCINASGCTGLVILPEGKIARIANVSDFNFEPAAGVMVAVPDADYLSFGYWVQVTGEGEDMMHGVSAFYSGKLPFDDDDITTNTNAAIMTLMGSAKYDGPATGMFVLKSDVDGDGKGLVPTASGQFTADATLTANFGSDTAADANAFSISGTVNGFEGDGIDETWELGLNKARLTVASYAANGDITHTNHSNSFSGSTSTGEGGSPGEWRGQFFGAVPDTDPDAAGVQPGDDNYPAGVAGEFNGHFENGHVIGAFGAPMKQ